MKTNNKIMEVLFLGIVMNLLFSTISFSQAPLIFNYQAVLRDATGNLRVNTPVNIEISILRENASGTEVFSETHSATTNSFGLVNLRIGSINPAGFANIDWADGSYYIQLSVDGIEMGTSQLLSVPYALHAKTADNISNFNTLQLNGIGLPYTFGPNPAYVGSEGNFIGFGHDGVSEDFIGYKNNTFYFKDSPEGGDITDPDVVVGGKLGVGIEILDDMLEVDGDIDVHNNTVKNLTDPVNAQDAATKAYVDANEGFSGDYNDLSNKPGNATSTNDGFMVSADKAKLEGIATGAEVNVNADWNATSGDAQILHKPTIPVAGTAAGQMLYWNGSAWVTVAPGIEGQVLTFFGGVPTWKGATVEVGDIENPTTGNIWMDRNLGAFQVATSPTDAASYGDIYQWGRATDGHEKRTSGTTATLSTGDTPGHADFITNNSSSYYCDWRSPQNTNLWQGVSGTNNPCPNGYRLPTDAEWNAERLSWSSNNAAGAFASPLKLPVAGRRIYSSGSLSSVGSAGDYWSGTVDGASSRVLVFDSSNALMGSNYRAYGLSVRCIKD